ncbi:MAG: DUF4271 domain-containing protein [Tannerellaceae bacterium]|jgi:hypothetical protein|nr:DUF4271 domain-containing protein [Tannerellaceae bacterium]
MDKFEGYVGIQLGDGQLVNDVIFSLLFALLIVFALVYHRNYHLFLKMVRDVFYVKERLSLFEDIDGNETVFRSFMIFQALLLCAIALFLVSRSQGFITTNYQEVGINLLAIGAIWLILFLFYLLKQLMYQLLGSIFTEAGAYKTWRVGYTASVGFWGVLLYVPVLWLAFVAAYWQIPLFLFGVLFILWRLIIIHKTIWIFNIRGIGFLYIILYLCAQEILPLIFLYEGIIYMYNLY